MLCTAFIWQILMSDDFYTMMDDDEGDLGFRSMDLAVGRILFDTKEGALAMETSPSIIVWRKRLAKYIYDSLDDPDKKGINYSRKT